VAGVSISLKLAAAWTGARLESCAHTAAALVSRKGHNRIRRQPNFADRDLLHFSNAEKGMSMRISRASVIIAAGLEKDRRRAHIRGMSEKPKFRTKMIKDGRWTVAVTAGYGPASHVGDFATEEEAQRWISTKSKDWSRIIPNDPQTSTSEASQVA
jgi:hypothetical protein